VVLVIVGTMQLRSFVEGVGGSALPAWVRIVEPREAVGDLFAAADVFLSASRDEGFPYSLGEALANGLPVVCSDIPGTQWALRVPGVQAFTAGDAASLEQALEVVTSRSSTLRETFARGARRFTEEHLSLRLCADRLTSLYSEVLAEHHMGLDGDSGRA
jgi:glycosyltransferase involved in cell wall biosynthesis